MLAISVGGISATEATVKVLMILVCSTFNTPSTASSRNCAFEFRKLACSTRDRTSRTSVLISAWFSLRIAVPFSAPTKVRIRERPSRVSDARVVTSPTWPRVNSASFSLSLRRCILKSASEARKVDWLALSISAPTFSRISAIRSTICSNKCSMTASADCSSVGWRCALAPKMVKARGVA